MAAARRATTWVWPTSASAAGRSRCAATNAAKLDPADEAAWWNTGIAATALGEWATARLAWQAFGIELPPVVIVEDRHIDAKDQRQCAGQRLLYRHISARDQCRLAEPELEVSLKKLYRNTDTSSSAQADVRLWRMPADQHPTPPGADKQRSVELERGDRCTTDRGPAENVCPVVAPREVLIPALRAWIEQRHNFMRLWILGVRLRPFDLITRSAGAPQVLADSQTACGNGNDMLAAK